MLIVAASDPEAAVVNQALDALQPVIAALYADVGVGHQHFLGIVTAVAATIRSPFHTELSISALHVMQGIARQLSQSDPQVGFLLAVVEEGGKLHRYLPLQCGQLWLLLSYGWYAVMGGGVTYFAGLGRRLSSCGLLEQGLIGMLLGLQESSVSGVEVVLTDAAGGTACQVGGVLLRPWGCGYWG